MFHIGRRIALSEQHGRGVSCNEQGLFVAAVPLLALADEGLTLKRWRPRPVADLNRDLSKCYGFPIDFSGKTAALEAIARALGRGDMLHARIATLHMEIPDPPLAEPAPTAQQVIALAKTLRMSGLLKADWNPAKHPRWPAGSPDSIGGQFASIGSGNSADTPAETGRPPVIPAQISIPFPFGSAVSRPIPWPSEIVPPAGIIPDVNPRRELTNPYPDRPECEEEWREAIAYCQELARKGFGWDGYRGMGKNFRECVMGQVSAGCGGNPTT